MPTIQSFHEAVTNIQPINLLEYVDVIPEFKVMNDCQHENPHHLEGSILVHANMAGAEVLKYMDQVPEQNDKVALYLSTIIHDIGKPSTKIYKEAKKKSVYYGHDKAGVPLAKDFLFKYFPELDYHTKNKILSLIEWHMRPRIMMKDGTKDKKLNILSLCVNTKLLYLLSMADTLGRTADDMSGCDLLEKFKAECERLNIWDRPYVVAKSEKLSNHAYTIARWNILMNGRPETQETLDQAVKLASVLPKFQILILAGPPGSGKTTYRETLLKQFPGTTVCSMDDKRQELLGDVNDQSANTAMFRICCGELRTAMQKRQSAIWDCTSASKVHRKAIIDIARKAGALVGCVYFDLSLQTILERNANREKKVPESVVKEYYYKRMERVESYECDKVTIISNEK
jgi:predicted kinase